MTDLKRIGRGLQDREQRYRTEGSVIPPPSTLRNVTRTVRGTTQKLNFASTHLERQRSLGPLQVTQRLTHTSRDAPRGSTVGTACGLVALLMPQWGGRLSEARARYYHPPRCSSNIAPTTSSPAGARRRAAGARRRAAGSRAGSGGGAPRPARRGGPAPGR